MKGLSSKNNEGVSYIMGLTEISLLQANLSENTLATKKNKQTKNKNAHMSKIVHINIVCHAKSKVFCILTSD